MRIYIVGVGGLGGYYGALFARVSADVTFVARGQKCKDLKERGLQVTDRGDKFHVSSVKVVESLSEVREPELIILAVKTYDIENVAKQMTVPQGCTIITLQNGIDNDLRVQKHLPHVRVFAGNTWALSTMISPGVIEQKSPMTFIKFGSRKNPQDPALLEIKNILDAGGIEGQVSDNIERDLWEKFVWLASFSGMAGTCRSPIGPIVSDPVAFEVWMRSVDETLALAKALNIPLHENTRANIVERLETCRTLYMDAKPSLLVDLENGRQTEIEALSGTIVKLARERGMLVPTHELMYSAIKLGHLVAGDT
jgi:2-dehydropantoate 2-reductase